MSGETLNDPVRLRVLAESRLMDSAPEEEFDRLTRLAQRMLAVPAALVTLLDERRQFFKSAVGLAEGAARETPLSHSFCQHVVDAGATLVIEDTLLDPHTRDNPAVREFSWRSYLGCPIRTSDGWVLGAFCVVDRRPRIWSAEERATMEELAAIAIGLVELRLAQARQRELGDRLVKISTQVPGVIYQFLWRPDGTSCFPYASEGMRSVFRLAPEEVRSDASKAFAVLHPDDYDDIVASIQESARQLTPWRHEFRVQFPDGQGEWLRGDATPERLPDGSVLWHGFITNVSARKQQEMWLREALVEGQARQDALDHHALMSITDLSGKILYANRKFCEVSGYSEMELVGQNHRLVRSHVHDEAFFREMWRTIASGRSWHGEICNRNKQGGLYWVASTILPLPGEDGKPERYISVRTDITRQKRTEAALRHAKATESILLNATDYIIISTDTNGVVVSINAAGTRILGYTAEELVGRETPALWHDLAEVEQRARVLSAELGRTIEPGFEVFVAKARETGAPDEHVWTFVRKDGTRFPVMLTATCLRDDAGAIMGYLGVIKDISEALREEEEKRALEKKLADTAKLESLGVLAGGIAHDFNNILTGVLGHASLLKLELPPHSPHLRPIEQIEQASRRAADLCRQMLAYSGRGRFVIRNIDLNTVIQDTTRLVEISISKRTVMRYHLADALPAIAADETQIRQVVMNLVINGSEAIGERSGVVAIATGVSRIDARSAATIQFGSDIPLGDYVWLEVSDNGSGMTPEVVAKIFDPFFTTKFAGRGLGLAAVQGIVRGHKGAIKVYSEPGKGTTFRLLFPCAPQRLADPVKPTTAAAPQRGKGRVLIIDDEETVRTVAARILEYAGFTVESAADGIEGVALFRRDPARYALVLLDLTMPHIDGEETFRQLRHTHPGVRVLLMSGFNHQEVITRFAGKGLAGFVPKPIESEELIRKALELTQAGGPG